MAIVTVGIDTAKSVFAVRGVDEAGKVQLRQPKVARAKLNELIAGLPPCAIGIEACTGSHHWARQFQARGHTVKLMAPKLATPYRMSGQRGKNDAADAAAICEAVARPAMRFVPVRAAVSADTARARRSWLRARPPSTASAAGWPSSASCWRRRQRSCAVRPAIIWKRCPATRAAKIIGIGELGASALTAGVGDFTQFKGGHQLGAWLGLVHSQNSSGGVARLGRITKRGDDYLRTLLIRGAKAAVMSAGKRDDATSRWLVALTTCVGWQKACVAMANKNARILWAVMTRELGFERAHVSAKPACKSAARDPTPVTPRWPPARQPESDHHNRSTRHQRFLPR